MDANWSTNYILYVKCTSFDIWEQELLLTVQIKILLK